MYDGRVWRDTVSVLHCIDLYDIFLCVQISCLFLRIQATSIHVNPLYLMLPVTVSTSFAFMLPVATPPNAIVFAYGEMKILDMVKAAAHCCQRYLQFYSV